MSHVNGTSLYGRIKDVWRREQLLRILEGALLLVRWLPALMLVAGLTDWLVCRWFGAFPSAGRAIMLLAIVSVSLQKAWLAGWKHIRRFDARRTALQIEEQKGGMESLLVTALQLRDAEQRKGTSSALCDLACRKAEAAADGIHAKEAVRFGSLRLPAMLACVVLSGFGLVAFITGSMFEAGILRLLVPWSDVRYPTRTQLELLHEDVVVQEGAPVRLAARITGVIPRQALIAIRTGDSKPRIRKLDIDQGVCEYAIETAYRGFEYRFLAGDVRSRWHRVEVIHAPNIQRAEVTLQYPEYTQKPVETVEALTITVPEATTVKWTLSLDRAVREATMNLAGEEPIPLAIHDDGHTVSVERVAASSRAYSFTWVEREHGFVFSSPNNYLQVAPDRPPRVELLSPSDNIYATLGRKLDLAFRGSDDHGVAQAYVYYRVDKTEEERIAFHPTVPIEGMEQVIDWDYRSVLTNLVVGQTVTFVVELADAYPGENGPNIARSDARRIQFVSMEDYLEQVEKQRKRLLARLRTTYREERKVHEDILRLDRSDPIFVQSCQLEAVRQDLMREGLGKLAGQIRNLADDLVANGVTDSLLIPSLEGLRADVLAISSNHLSQAAEALRLLASETGRQADAAHQHAIHMVNSSARELGLLVLQLGYEDAAEVMAREMHAAAETQAALRLRTITPDGNAAELATDQERLGKWLTRLFAASPREKESTITDAILAFTLTRIVKQMVNGGMDADLGRAAALIREGRADEASEIQTGIIAALLKGAFRLRVGAEREILAKAMELLMAQAEAQRQIRSEIATLDERAFKDRHSQLMQMQDKLHRNLQLLLMPAVPAAEWKLFDVVAPETPPVARILNDADRALRVASASIKQGARPAAIEAMSDAESLFLRLADVARQRITTMTQAVRIERMVYAASEIDQILGRLGERQLSLLEKTEDAAADGEKSDYLADQQESLADALEELKREMLDMIERSAAPAEHALALPENLNDILQSMRTAVAHLRDNKPEEAIPLEESVVSGLAAASEMLAEHGGNLGSYAGMVAMTMTAVKPSPYVAEIVEEQRDMYQLTKDTGAEDLPGLAIAQKNLVHAVDAILLALDPVSHLVETGTIMLFAKADMDAAGDALLIKDDTEALDAQDFIIETLGELRAKIDEVVPKYKYLHEISGALHENFQEGIFIREAQRKLRESVARKMGDAAAIAKEQSLLRGRAEAYGRLMNSVTGFDLGVAAIKQMSETEVLLHAGDPDAAIAKMKRTESLLREDSAIVLKLMRHITLVLAPPPDGMAVPEEIVLLQEVLGLAASQKQLYRSNATADAKDGNAYAEEMKTMGNGLTPFIERASKHSNPLQEDDVAATAPANLQRHLVQAQESLAKASALASEADRESIQEHQRQASDSLRHFACEYAFKFALIPPPPAPGDPAPSTSFTEAEDLLSLYMPGAVSGKRPPDGQLEWEVLGKRDRAALNENFARELPLEYRAILKDYYERLAR